MSRNLSNLDRGLRSFLVAPVAIVLAVVVGAGSIGGILLFALAAIVLATGAVGFCPLYARVHLNTRYRRYPRNKLKSVAVRTKPKDEPWRMTRRPRPNRERR